MESQTQGTNINHINNKDKQQTEHKELLSPIKSSVLILARPRAQPAGLRVSPNEKVINTLIRLRNSDSLRELCNLC
jgi:hypothetical protein